MLKRDLLQNGKNKQKIRIIIVITVVPMDGVQVAHLIKDNFRQVDRQQEVKRRSTTLATIELNFH